MGSSAEIPYLYLTFNAHASNELGLLFSGTSIVYFFNGSEESTDYLGACPTFRPSDLFSLIRSVAYPRTAVRRYGMCTTLVENSLITDIFNPSGSYYFSLHNRLALITSKNRGLSKSKYHYTRRVIPADCSGERAGHSHGLRYIKWFACIISARN